MNKDYPSPEELTEEALDENSSLKKMLQFIGKGKQVVDFGCATGLLAHLLQKRDCIVTGIEINPDAARVAEKYCEKVIVADLDFVSITKILPKEKFDVVIFGDVLEHLRNPWKVLEETKSILKEYGFVVASIPNIAHGAIRLALLNGKFEYTNLGILDDTHLRFFTRKTSQELFKNTGYFIDEIDRTKLPVFSDSDLIPQLHENNFSEEVIQYLDQDKDVDTLQFIIRAFPLAPEGQDSLLNTRYQQVLAERDLIQSQLEKTQGELAKAEFKLQQTQAELEKSQSQLQVTETQREEFQSELQQTQAELEKSQSQLQVTETQREEFQSELQQTQAELEKSQSQLQATETELERSQSELQHSQKELQQLQSQLQYSQRELERSQSQLQHTQRELEKSQFQLQKTETERDRSQSQLQNIQRELEYSKTTIAAMETSKFWKLRKLWFKFKEPKLKSIFSNKNHTSNFISPQQKTELTYLKIEEVLPPKAITKHSLSVDVIVCVHNAFEDVKNCLESVIRYSSNPYTIIIVNDGSDEETSEYLADFARTQNATLIRNQVAKGYTFAANQGLQKSKADYAILLNSDTIVTPNWLDRIVACGESDPKIGIIGPLSNTASWQSIPEITENGDWAENKLPPGMTISYMGKLVADYSWRLYPRISFLNGFCLAIKRQTIASIGYFDEQTFGAGYGEENDYCLRAQTAGWQLAIADDTYIYHSQSRSYSHERRKLLCDRADKALISKHGQQIVSDGVNICQNDRVIAGMRSRSRIMLSRQKFITDGKSRWEGKRVLIILPIMHPGGGGNVVFQEATAMQQMGVDVRIVNFNHHRHSFENGYPENTIPIIYVDKEHEISYLLPEYDAVIATLYKSVYWLELSHENDKKPVRGYYIQDFEPYFFSQTSPEYEIAWKSYTKYSDLVKFTKTEWNHNLLKNQLKTDSAIVGASVNLDLYRPQKRRDVNWPERPLRITAMIRPDSPRRAAELTMQILQKIALTHGNNIEIIIFGCQSDDPKFLQLTQDFSWYNAGILTRSQLAFLLNEVDIFVDFSSFQAMGLTAMEAMACGAAVIVPETGGAASFAIHEQNSLIVDTSSEEACFNQLNRLILDQQLREKLQQTAINDICEYFPEKAAHNILNSLFPGND
ncbi:glycosyltransferase [Nodularia harveyana UHCC-0300]|uniref:Glycosyltransferase n=1 Tax=Nodularia harveyana UHCC-0300 TaxID=2974287 RepID=A0ABU5UH04_9CYAN|nr:glycosyltransferase [Nodularia harveyana]MEA5582848.1 glycosyltransferase [Nodularia harveyana UHCC-0300]